MPLHSRIWIYQSIREFSENEITLLKNIVVILGDRFRFVIHSKYEYE